MLGIIADWGTEQDEGGLQINIIIIAMQVKVFGSRVGNLAMLVVQFRVSHSKRVISEVRTCHRDDRQDNVPGLGIL